ncbi:hypothetical protein HDU79_007845 [Rhizoclosmatium sp. JEL0117]|nr:hypothetical protein HDU79_007845 [Rhizoclosmatium sp. JEL0117]
MLVFPKRRQQVLHWTLLQQVSILLVRTKFTCVTDSDFPEGKCRVPKTCADLGATSGKHDDGYGHTLNCDNLDLPECNGKCCAPKTCSDFGGGDHFDGCGNTITCPYPITISSTSASQSSSVTTESFGPTISTTLISSGTGSATTLFPSSIQTATLPLQTSTFSSTNTFVSSNTSPAGSVSSNTSPTGSVSASTSVSTNISTTGSVRTNATVLISGTLTLTSVGTTRFAEYSETATKTSEIGSTKTILAATLTTVPSCVTNIPLSTINEIALGPIPAENSMQLYNGDVAAYIAALLKLLPSYGSAISQLGSSLFYIPEPIVPGQEPSRFQATPFLAGSNLVAVLISSSQYEFVGEPTIQTYFGFSCNLVIKESPLPSISGVGFSYVIDSVQVKSEWFAMFLTPDGQQLVFTINTNHSVIASLTFPLKVIRKRQYQSNGGFVVLNGVWPINVSTPFSTASAPTSTALSTRQQAASSTSTLYVPSSTNASSTFPRTDNPPRVSSTTIPSSTVTSNSTATMTQNRLETTTSSRPTLNVIINAAANKNLELTISLLFFVSVMLF